MKELEEATSKLQGILDAGDMILNPPEYMVGFIDKEAVKQSRIDQILNLKGDGWKIAIINPRHRLIKDGDFKQVIWEAEND